MDCRKKTGEIQTQKYHSFLCGLSDNLFLSKVKTGIHVFGRSAYWMGFPLLLSDGRMSLSGGRGPWLDVMVPT
jgi:hypothetical protein